MAEGRPDAGGAAFGKPAAERLLKQRPEPGSVAGAGVDDLNPAFPQDPGIGRRGRLGGDLFQIFEEAVERQPRRFVPQHQPHRLVDGVAALFVDFGPDGIGQVLLLQPEGLFGKSAVLNQRVQDHRQHQPGAFH